MIVSSKYWLSPFIMLSRLHQFLLIGIVLYGVVCLVTYPSFTNTILKASFPVDDRVVVNPLNVYSTDKVALSYIVFSGSWEKILFPERVQAIKRTWGKRVTSEMIYVQNDDNMINFPDITIWQMDTYDQKSNLLFHVLDRIVSRDQKEKKLPKWYYFSSDSAYVIVENLENLLKSLDPTIPLYIGHPLRLPTNDTFSWPSLKNLIFNSLSGFALSSKAATVLLEQFHLGCASRCNKCGMDLKIAFCLRERGILAMDTRDEFGKDRFHVFQPTSLVGNVIPKSQVYTPKNCEWYLRYSMWKIRMNLDCCSTGTIVFHYINMDEMYSLHYALRQARNAYEEMENVTLEDHAMLLALRQYGGKSQKEFGGYLAAENQRVRLLLLQHIQIGREYPNQSNIIRDIVPDVAITTRLAPIEENLQIRNHSIPMVSPTVSKSAVDMKINLSSIIF